MPRRAKRKLKPLTKEELSCMSWFFDTIRDIDESPGRRTARESGFLLWRPLLEEEELELLKRHPIWSRIEVIERDNTDLAGYIRIRVRVADA